MYEEISNLITPCCIEHKLHAITQGQLMSQAPLSTNVFTMGDITLVDLIDWLVTRFPASTMTVVAQSMPMSLANMLARHLGRHWNEGKNYIDHLDLYLPPPVEGEIRTDPFDGNPSVQTLSSRQHDIGTLILMDSPKGHAVLQGSWPTDEVLKPTLAVMSYSNSETVYHQSQKLLRFLKPLQKNEKKKV